MQGRQVLLVGDNFGAGSSREHAPWALTAWGIKAIISTSFADIFRNNSMKNGLLPIVVDPATHQRITDMLDADPDAGVTVDLSELGLLLPDGSTVDFEVDPFARQMMLAGHRRDRLGAAAIERHRRLGGDPPGARGHPARPGRGRLRVTR